MGIDFFAASEERNFSCTLNSVFSNSMQFTSSSEFLFLLRFELIRKSFQKFTSSVVLWLSRLEVIHDADEALIGEVYSILGLTLFQVLSAIPMNSYNRISINFTLTTDNTLPLSLGSSQENIQN